MGGLGWLFLEVSVPVLSSTTAFPFSPLQKPHEELLNCTSHCRAKALSRAMDPPPTGAPVSPLSCKVG